MQCDFILMVINWKEFLKIRCMLKPVILKSSLCLSLFSFQGYSRSWRIIPVWTKTRKFGVSSVISQFSGWGIWTSSIKVQISLKFSFVFNLPWAITWQIIEQKFYNKVLYSNIMAFLGSTRDTNFSNYAKYWIFWKLTFHVNKTVNSVCSYHMLKRPNFDPKWCKPS